MYTTNMIKFHCVNTAQLFTAQNIKCVKNFAQKILKPDNSD